MAAAARAAAPDRARHHCCRRSTATLPPLEAYPAKERERIERSRNGCAAAAPRDAERPGLQRA
jgi:hypothetical protein